MLSCSDPCCTPRTAARSQAFKAVSKAFSCLSDPDKRAFYNRTGHESSSAAAAAQQATRASAYQRAGPGAYYADEIDPEEIFNMFFGTPFGGPRHGGFSHVYRAQQARARAQQQQHQQAQHEQQRSPLSGLLHFAPVLILFIVFSLLSGSQEPAYALAKDPHRFPAEVKTARLDLPFYVRAKEDLDRSFPKGSHARAKLERQIEQDYYDKVMHRCQQERYTQQRLVSWGRRDKAEAMATPACNELEQINAKLPSSYGRSRYGGY